MEREDPKPLGDNGINSLLGMQKRLKDKMTSKIASLKESLQCSNKESFSKKLWLSERVTGVHFPEIQFESAVLLSFVLP